MTNISVSRQTTKVTQCDFVIGHNVYFLTLINDSHANLFCRIPTIHPFSFGAIERFWKLNETLRSGTAVVYWRTDTVNVIHNHVMNKQKYQRGTMPWLTTLVRIISVISMHWRALGKSQVDSRVNNNCLLCVFMNITCVHQSTL